MKTNFLRLFLNILLVLSLSLNGYFLYKKYKQKKEVSGGPAMGGAMSMRDTTSFD